MGLFDKATAGTFEEAPGAERFDPPVQRRQTRWLILTAYIATSVFGFWFVRGYARALWGAGATAALGLAMAIVNLFLDYKFRWDRGDRQPYSDHRNITR